MAIGAKPFSIQAPEDIAKSYGGDKRKILEAMQRGIVDPTAGTLAGMFIDRMRAAAAAEQAGTPSVAQDTFGGLQAPAAPAAMQGAVQMGAGPQMPQQVGGLEAAPVPEAMFSAGGGIVGYERGGPVYSEDELLFGLGLISPEEFTSREAVRERADSRRAYERAGVDPDEAEVMYQAELERSGPAPVAQAPTRLAEVAAGGESGPPRQLSGPPVAPTPRAPTPRAPVERTSTPTSTTGTNPEDIIVVEEEVGNRRLRGYDLPEEIAGFYRNPMENRALIEDLTPQQRERAQRVTEFYDRMLDPEEQAARRRDDKWEAIGRAGAAMASTPGSFLQSLSAGLSEGTSAYREAIDERRDEELTALNALAQQENLTNQQAREVTALALELQKTYGTLANALMDQDLRVRLAQMGIDADQWRVLQTIASSERVAGMQAGIAREGMYWDVVGDILRSGGSSSPFGQYSPLLQGFSGGATGGSQFDFSGVELPGEAGKFLRAVRPAGGNVTDYDSNGNPIQR